MTAKYSSVFDIIGPIMVGPSSSHTAGAARIGKFAREMFQEKPTEVDIYSVSYTHLTLPTKRIV